MNRSTLGAIRTSGLVALALALLRPPALRYTKPRHAHPPTTEIATTDTLSALRVPPCGQCATEERTVYACIACGRPHCTACLALLDFTRLRFYCPPCLERARLA